MLRFALLATTALIGVLASHRASAQTVISVATASDLQAAISTVDANPSTSYQINITGPIALTTATELPAINSASTVTITGTSANSGIDGGGVTRGLLIIGGTVTVQNLSISNAVAQGGAGGAAQASGGGGAGLGGGLFVGSGATVTLSGVNFSTNKGIGGNGGATNLLFGGGGGGGLGGTGGSGNNGFSGGGGGVGLTATGGADTPTAGSPGIVPGAASGGASAGGQAGGATAGGGGGGGLAAGGGGVGGGVGTGNNGGAGGFGGGGGAALANGGAGGFGGGGGSGGTLGTSGAGGFGGGSGAGYNLLGVAGFGGGTGGQAVSGGGAGTGSAGGGGGGLGAGGDIFVQAGGTLILQDGSLIGSTVTGGTAVSGGTAGSAFGSSIFGQGNNTLTLAPAAGKTLLIGGTIADQTGSGGTGANAGIISLVTQGTGTVTLAGANTYSGGTTVNLGSTLSIAAANNTGTGTTTLNGGILKTTNTAAITLPSLALGASGGTLNATSGAVSVSSAMTGSGGFSTTGPATVTLTGANTYTGGTTVSAGTLVVGNGATSGSITGNATVASGAELEFNRADAITVPGAITGAGSLVQAGSGTLTLTGADSLGQGITVDSGTLAVGAGGSLAGTPVTLASAGTTFDISAAGNQTLAGLNGVAGSSVRIGAATLTLNTTGVTPTPTYAGSISGAGGVTKQGTGTQLLTGTNSYTGPTSITGGTLALGAADGTGAGTGSIASSSGVTLASGATLALGATASGLPATATYTLQDLAGAAGSTVAVGGNTLNFGTANSTTFSGAFTGTGAGLLEKQGSGTVTLDGNSSSYAGTTILNAGTVIVGDTQAASGAVLGGSVGLNPGTTLGGFGTIGGNVVNAGGTVQPGGASIGRLTVTGNYVQGSAGTLAIQITPYAASGAGVGYDQLAVGGTASLAGTLAVSQTGSGYVVGSTYDIVHAGAGVTGGFTSIAYNPLYAQYLTPTVRYGANDAILLIQPTLPGGAIAPAVITPTTYSNAPAFSTGRGVAAQSYVVNQGVFETLGTLLDGASELHIAAPLYTNPQLGTWVEGFGGYGRANGYSIQNYGGLAGHGVQVTPNLVVGAAVAGLGNQTKDGYQRVEGQSIGVYGYGVYTMDRLRISGTGGIGSVSADSIRELMPTSLTARGSSLGWYGAAALQAQYRVTLGPAFLIPFANARYVHTDSGDMRESGAESLNLLYSAIHSDAGAFGGGVRAGFSVPASFGTLIPWASVGGTGYVGGRHVSNLETLGVIGASESANAVPTATLDTGVGVDMIGSGRWRFTAAWTGNYATQSQGNAFELVARYRW